MLRKKLNPKPPNDMEDLDTVIYQVVPDALHPGEFLIQMMRFAGIAYSDVNSSYIPSITTPVTILRGLVGPSFVGGSSTDPPPVFSYYGRLPVDKNNSSGKIIKLSPTVTNVENILGVGIDVDVKKTDLLSDNTATQQPSFYGIHNETFIRSNRNITLNNFSR